MLSPLLGSGPTPSAVALITGLGLVQSSFQRETKPLNIPIVQVSLVATKDPAQHIALGRAVSYLRDERIQIIVSGMAVHNLRDMQWGLQGVKPYAKSCDEALREAVETEDELEREEKLVQLLKISDARPVHPSFEHLLPIHVGAGAARGDKGKRLWTLAQKGASVGHSSSLEMCLSRQNEKLLMSMDENVCN